MFKSILVFALVLAGSATQAQTLTPEMKAQFSKEIDYVGNLFMTEYAPKAWKEKYLGWNLPAEIATAQLKLSIATDLYGARMAMAGVIKSTADYHVGFSFYSTERALLGFQVKTVEGKTLIVAIDRTKLSTDVFPFSEGDEILTVDGVPVAGILSDLQMALGSNVPKTDLAMADLVLTRRNASSGIKVPRGPVTVAVKSASTGTTESVQLTWDYKPENLSRFFQASMTPLNTDKKLPQMVSERALSYGLGKRDSFLPQFGEKIWETTADNSFQAYIYQNKAGKMVGVVRIPSYLPDNMDKAVKDFAGIVQKMEKFTSAMVIDQNNNPGGSLFYLYYLVSTLSPNTMIVPKHKVALSYEGAKANIETIKALEEMTSDDEMQKAMGGKTLHGYPVNYQFGLGVLDFSRFFMSEFKTGKNISESYYLWGVDKINPSQIANYTKPIVILVNQLDFSGGDFFPAIMQDNKRATIVGTRTAGAGGYVLSSTFPNTIGLSHVSYTGSLAERVDLNPIENLGVTPDVELPMTVEDVRGGYKAYIKKVQEIVNRQIQ